MSVEYLGKNTCKVCDQAITSVRVAAINGDTLDEWWSHDSIPEDPHEPQVTA